MGFGARMKRRVLVVRRSIATDAEGLAELTRASVALHGGAWPCRHGDTTEAHGFGIETLLAETREGVQGALQLQWDPRPAAMGWMLGSVELRRHCVRACPSHPGVAARLLQAAMREARRRGARCVWLKVDKDASHAIGFYHRHGFRIAGAAFFLESSALRERWVMRHMPAATDGESAARAS
jgi:GNAT superfamily N-acetyltransferase